jgi:hypothetical protein
MFLSACHMRAFKTSDGLKGMYEYEVSITSNCRLAKNHSVMSQNVLGGLNHSFTIFTLINSPILIDLVLNVLKTQNWDTICLAGKGGGGVEDNF